MPPFTAQYTSYSLVAKDVGANFFFPERGIGFWHGIAAFMSMPETPVRKNCDMLVFENEIWTARQNDLSSPPSNPHRLKKVNQRYLRGYIPVGFNLRHYEGSFFPRDSIHQVIL